MNRGYNINFSRKKKRKKRMFPAIVISILVILSGSVVAKIGLSYIDNKYLDTKASQSDLPTSGAIDEGTYFEDSKDEGNTYIENDDEYLVLVNRSHKLSSSYEASDLVVPSIRFSAASNMTQHVREEVSIALENMFSKANKEGITLIGMSAYRSYDYQENIYNSKVSAVGEIEADKYVAIPGTSEHQTGLAIDVLSSDYSTLDAEFENTDAFKWLSENMSKYGFILRYPKGKEEITGYEYEPWHLRYVGKDIAEKIMSQGITLEEYLNK